MPRRQQTSRSTSEWVDEINAGLEYRSLFGLEPVWTDLEAKFFAVTEDADVGPNLVMAKGDTIISALSVPEVQVLVRPRTREAAEVAPLVEAFDNSLLYALEIGEAMEQALLYSYLFGGVGFVKLGYDSEFGYDTSLELPAVGGSLSQFGKKGELLESGIARSGMPWALPVMPHDVVVPWGTRTLEDAPWIAHRTVREVAAVRADRKYHGAGAGLKARLDLRDITLGYSFPRERVEDATVHPFEGVISAEKRFIEVWEVMDRLERRVVAIAMSGTDDKPEPVKIRDDVNSLQIDNRLPWVDVRLGMRTRGFWTTPMAYYVKPHQEELDDIHRQAKIQRRASILKLLARKGTFDSSAIENLLSAEPAVLVEVNETMNGPLSDSVVYTGGNQGINILLHQEDEVIQANAREALGVSRNLSGEYQGKTHITSHETGLVEQGGEVRMGRKQQALRRSYRKLVEMLNAIVAEHWRVPQVVRVVGRDGVERWEQLKAEMLRGGRYTFDIQFSAEYYETPQRRQQEAMGLYATLLQDPRVDRDALLRMLIDSFNNPGLRQGRQGGGANALQLQMPGVSGRGGTATPGGGAGSPSEV